MNSFFEAKKTKVMECSSTPIPVGTFVFIFDGFACNNKHFNGVWTSDDEFTLQVKHPIAFKEFMDPDEFEGLPADEAYAAWKNKRQMCSILIEMVLDDSTKQHQAVDLKDTEEGRRQAMLKNKEAHEKRRLARKKKVKKEEQKKSGDEGEESG